MGGNLKRAALLGSNTSCSGAEPSWAKDSIELSHQLHRNSMVPGRPQPHPVPCLGLSTGQRSRISPCARTGVWWKMKHQSWAESLRQLVFRLPGKTRHLILPSGTSADTQQLLGPSQAVPNPSLSKHPSTIPDPIPLLRGGPAPHRSAPGTPQLHLQPHGKTQQTSKEPNPQTSVPSLCFGEGCQDDTANKNNPNSFQRTLSPP